MVLLAPQQLQYPPRPAQPHRSSQSVATLRQVLEDAPRRRSLDGTQSIVTVHGITEEHDHEDNPSFRWSDSYLRQLYQALIDVIYEHADAGWTSIRWEVYDKQGTLVRAIVDVADGK